MQGLATAQRHYDRRMPPDYHAAFDEDHDTPATPHSPLATLHADLARDPDAAQDISTAWIDKLFGADDSNLVVARLLAGEDAMALALIKHALETVALERSARRTR